MLLPASVGVLHSSTVRARTLLAQPGLFSPERGVETGLIPAPAAPLALPAAGLLAVGVPAPYPCACLLGCAASPSPSTQGPFLLCPNTWGVVSPSYSRASGGCRKLCAAAGRMEREGDPATLLGQSPVPSSWGHRRRPPLCTAHPPFRSPSCHRKEGKKRRNNHMKKMLIY